MSFYQSSGDGVEECDEVLVSKADVSKSLCSRKEGSWRAMNVMQCRLTTSVERWRARRSSRVEAQLLCVYGAQPSSNNICLLCYARCQGGCLKCWGQTLFWSQFFPFATSSVQVDWEGSGHQGWIQMMFAKMLAGKQARGVLSTCCCPSILGLDTQMPLTFSNAKDILPPFP